MITFLNMKRFFTYAIVISLVINVSWMLWYIFIGYEGLFHSDSATKVLLAQHIYETGEFFPNDWTYANGDLWIILGHLFVLPFLWFFPAGFTLHAISGVIFTFLLFSGIWMITGIREIPTWHRIVVISIMAAGISPLVAENLYGQVSYGIVIFFSCYIIYTSYKYIDAEDEKRFIWGFLFILLIIFSYWSNPKRALITHGAPLFISILWLIFFTRNKKNVKFISLLGLSFLGTLIGSFLYMQTIKKVNIALGETDARWTNYESILNNISLSVKEILKLLDGLSAVGQPLLSLGGMIGGIHLIIALAILFFLPFSIRKAILSNHFGSQFFALFAFFTFLFSLIVVLFTTLSEGRYLVPGFILCLLVFFTERMNYREFPIKSTMVAFIFFVLIISSFSSYGLPSKNFIANNDVKIRKDLISFLEQKNLRYGYATYWHAGILTVLSDGQIKVRHITIDQGLPKPYHWLGADSWYSPSQWEARTFLLLKSSEKDFVNLEKMKLSGLTHSETLTFDDYIIYVFEQNLASKLIGWNQNYTSLTHIFPSASSLHQVGHLIEDENKLKLLALRGEHGALHFGPYISMNPGRYRVTFNIEADYNPSGVAKLDVVSSPEKLYGEKIITGSKEENIDFVLDSKSVIEFRVFAMGSQDVTLKKITVVNLDESKK